MPLYFVINKESVKCARSTSKETFKNCSLQMKSSPEITKRCNTTRKSLAKNDYRQINLITDYYKNHIKEMPPLSKTIAAVIANAPNKAANSDRTLNRDDTMVRNTPEKDTDPGFNPVFNSTANTYVLGNNETETYFEEQSEIAYKSIINCSSEDRKTKRKCDKSLQTVLTMDCFGRISEVLNNNIEFNHTEEIEESVGEKETFQLSKRRVFWRRECEKEGALAESELGWCGDCDVNVQVLTDAVRARVVNWLIKIDHYMGGDLTCLHCAVFFLDQLSSAGAGRLPGPAPVCGAACYWVAMKLHKSKVPRASVMAKYAFSNNFSAEDLIRCERRVLAILAFPPAPLLPVDETERIAELWSDTPEHELLVEGAHYVCCCALLHARLARRPATALAQAALAVAARALAPAHPCNHYFTGLRESERRLSRDLERLCRATSSPDCVCRAPYLRYCSRRRRHAVAPRLAAALSPATRSQLIPT